MGLRDSETVTVCRRTEFIPLRLLVRNRGKRNEFRSTMNLGAELACPGITQPHLESLKGTTSRSTRWQAHGFVRFNSDFLIEVLPCGALLLV